MPAGLVQELVDHVPGVICDHDRRDDEVGDLKDKKNGLHRGGSLFLAARLHQSLKGFGRAAFVKLFRGQGHYCC